jgi:hypothetical protein
MLLMKQSKSDPSDRVIRAGINTSAIKRMRKCGNAFDEAKEIRNQHISHQT